ncbi:MAG: DUF4350 domain-containing protein [Euryarchaeota archaeon]|nr:DUF4350 domain-containing protein [Euryarchaeota archaeon]
MRTIALSLLLLLPGCLQEEKPLLLVDYAHGEVFPPLDPRELGYSKLDEIFREAGYQVRVISEPLTEKELRRARVYLLAGPMSELSEEERAAVRGFVERGGRVVVLVHIASPLRGFLAEYNITLGWVLAEEVNTLGRPHDFVVRDVEGTGILKGVDSLSFHGAFSVRAPGRYALTSPNAWEDLNLNGVRDEGEPRGKFALIGIAKYGKGYVLVIGDDATLANRFIGEEDNLKLARNIAEWGLEEPHPK